MFVNVGGGFVVESRGNDIFFGLGMSIGHSVSSIISSSSRSSCVIALQHPHRQQSVSPKSAIHAFALSQQDMPSIFPIARSPFQSTNFKHSVSAHSQRIRIHILSSLFRRQDSLQRLNRRPIGYLRKGESLLFSDGSDESF